jgi:hypothetical protein
MKALPFIKPFFLNSDGTGAGAGYKLQTLEVGSETDKVTYKDPDGTTENLNPIILDGLGNFELFYSGNLKLRYLTPDDAVMWTIPNVEEIGGGGGTLSIVETMADLVALGAGEFNQVLLAGYYASGDKDARLYTWDGASTATVNNGTVVLPTGHVGAGRWLMEHLGEVSTLDFGMKGDNSTNDLTTLTQALIYVQANDLTLVVTPSVAALPYLINTVSAQLALGGGWKLKILPTASFSFTEAQTIGGIVEAGPHQWIATPSAAVTFGATARLVVGAFPEWWGGVADDTFDNVAVFAAMFASNPGTIFFSKGNWATSGGIGGIPAGTIITAIGQVEDMLETPLIPIGYQVKGAGTLIKAQDLEAVASIIAGNNITAGDQITAGNNIRAGQDAGEVGVFSFRAGTGSAIPRAIGRIAQNLNTDTTVGAGEEDLLSVSIPANSLVTDGDTLELWTDIVIGSGAGSTTIKAYLGAKLLFSGTVTNTGATAWSILRVKLWKKAANAIHAAGDLTYDGTVKTDSQNGAVTLTDPQTLKITATGPAGNTSEVGLFVNNEPAN